MSDESTVRILRIGSSMQKNWQQAIWIAQEAMKLISKFGHGKIVIQVQESNAMVRLKKYEKIKDYPTIIFDEFCYTTKSENEGSANEAE